MYRPGVAEFMERQRLNQAIRILRKKGCKHILLYIWRPEFGVVLDKVDYDLSFYHIDDEYTFSPVEKEISIEESTLIGRVNQVFIHSPALLAKKGHLNPNTLYVPNGVDYRAFSTKVNEPEDLKNIPHPRIGYMGLIKDRLDFPLMYKLAKSHPEWSFVFVGPKVHLGSFEQIVSELEKMKNVFFLGGRSVADLPGYAQHFDVCTLCYVINDYTKFIFPLKLNEYLATGRPVVGVPIPSIESFGNIIRLAQTNQEWSESISRSLEDTENTIQKAAERQQTAKQNDWSIQTHLIAKTMCARLGENYAQKLDSIHVQPT